jgi:hypothetical protein
MGLGDRDLSYFLITYQRVVFQVLEEDISGLDTIHISKRQSKDI